MENRFRFLRPCALGPLRTVDSVCTPAAAAGATQRRLLPLCLGRRPAVVKTNQRRREREKASFFLCCFTMSVDARSSSSPGVLAFAPYHYHCRCALHSILRPSLPVAPPLSPRFSLFPFRCGALDTNTKGVLRLSFSFPRPLLHGPAPPLTWTVGNAGEGTLRTRVGYESGDGGPRRVSQQSEAP